MRRRRRFSLGGCLTREVLGFMKELERHGGMGHVQV